MYIPFGEFRPDVSDFKGKHSIVLNNVLPRGDGYGPIASLTAMASGLNQACRGAFFARKSDGSVVIFAATSKRIFRLNNSLFTWVPVSTPVAVTSISNASPAVVTYTAHGFVADDPVVFTTDGALPTGITAGTVYYVQGTGLSDNTFRLKDAAGATINTSSAGSGTHSVTANYSEVPSTDQWQFAQYGHFVFAVQANVVPQVYDLSSSTSFSTLAGSPPQARYIAIVSRFVVLSGLTSTPFRIQWSGLNATTTWTSGTNSSDFQDFSDGGVLRGVAGGETGVIFQDGAIRRMTYAPGSPVIFQIERVTRDIGLYAPYSLVTVNNKVYFLASQGFHEMDPNGYPMPIGREAFDSTFLDEWDVGQPQLMIGVSDPRAGRAFFFYKTLAGAAGLFDKALIFDQVLRRASTASVTGEYAGSISQPGVTLEGLDAVSSSIDALTQSLDSYSSASTPELGVFNSSHVLSLFRGSNLEATMYTPEQGEEKDNRIFVRGVKPITDAATVYASALSRETQQAAHAVSAESLVNAIGYCPMRVSTRYARAKVRVPADISWNFCSGVEVDYELDGER
jgi:hypothetical protein